MNSNKIKLVDTKVESKHIRHIDISHGLGSRVKRHNNTCLKTISLASDKLEVVVIITA